ncbi:hypothetical protein KIH41_04265 [Litoribacter ruber]|uniref:hypothetical protein n=1 Tax=Litoribacter ruber TaxID=702568 RepID=UPI001BDB29B4|nr:hypothetical protein [Litoribacter ruber]MBT0810487.1 hypothetical protein [Litoribacter ruber]
MEDLIRKSYDNVYGFDLRKYHNDLYSTKNGVTPANLDLSLLSRERKIKDETNLEYEFILYDGKNYITNGINCFPCSPVSTLPNGNKFVEVMIIPNGHEIVIENNINESSVVPSSLQFNLIREIKSIDLLKYFIYKYRKTFIKNNWFKSNELVILAKSTYKSINLKSLFIYLKEEGLLNPLELVIGSLYYNIPINQYDLYESLINKNDISYGIHYLTTPKYKPQIAKSTKKIFKKNEIVDFIKSFSEEDVYEFFEIEYVRRKINASLLTERHLMVIFNIGDIDYFYNSPDISIDQYKRKLLKEINLTTKLVDSFYELVRQNLLKLEELVRLQHGYDIVGSLYAERYLYLNLKNEFPQFEIISQYSPDWLGRQRIDIFIKELNLAIEYNGKQHYEAIDYFGGLEGLKLNQERDDIKKNKCVENGVELIEIRYNEDLNTALKKLIDFIRLQA